jgi:hypothetical protein
VKAIAIHAAPKCENPMVRQLRRISMAVIVPYCV